MLKSLIILRQLREDYEYNIEDTDYVDEAIAELEAQEAKSCEWSYEEWSDGDMWKGECGVEWAMFDGTPKENGMHFCPRCGKKIIEKGNNE